VEEVSATAERWREGDELEGGRGGMGGGAERRRDRARARARARARKKRPGGIPRGADD
jgi:hypothetical protein